MADLNVPNIPIRINEVGHHSTGSRKVVSSTNGLIPVPSQYETVVTEQGATTTKPNIGGRVD